MQKMAYTFCFMSMLPNEKNNLPMEWVLSCRINIFVYASTLMGILISFNKIKGMIKINSGAIKLMSGDDML